MGYYDTVRDAKQMEKIKRQAMAEAEAQKQMEQEMAKQRQAQQVAGAGYAAGAQDAAQMMAPMMDQNMTGGQLPPQQMAMPGQPGMAPAQEDLLFTTDTGMAPVGGLGMDPAILDQMSADAMQQKAMMIVENLDKAQEEGADPRMLAEYFNQLDPRMKEMVQLMKQQKMQAQQEQMAQMRGQAQGAPAQGMPQQPPSPVTQKAYQILDETTQR